MKKFKFTLQKVYEYKQQVLDVLKSEYASLNEEINKVTASICELEEQYKTTNAELKEKLSGGMRPNDISVFKAYLARLNAQIIQLCIRKRFLEGKLEQKRNEIISVNKEIMTLESLKAKQLEAYRKAELKSQEILIEEFVSSARALKSG
ncbi:MAG TPA: flagellar export protein FliJ [Clostridiales bacterium]|nr:flagellar export protein FliJ [Clostridiales bacterium]